MAVLSELVPHFFPSGHDIQSLLLFKIRALGQIRIFRTKLAAALDSKLVEPKLAAFAAGRGYSSGAARLNCGFFGSLSGFAFISVVLISAKLVGGRLGQNGRATSFPPRGSMLGLHVRPAYWPGSHDPSELPALSFGFQIMLLSQEMVSKGVQRTVVSTDLLELKFAGPGKPFFVTMLLYLDEEWPLNWDAETMILDPRSGTGVFVRPAPCRMLLMDQVHL